MPDNTQPASTNVAVRSYAIRRVNPFLGVLQVIETIGGRAVSANGVVWDIEVLAERQDGWGSLNKTNRKTAYLRYGLWSVKDGLVNWPLSRHRESTPLAQQCNELIDGIGARLQQLPFKLADQRELWLFDSDNQQPLALLATATANSALPSPEPKYWSASIGTQGMPSQNRYPAASELEELVRQRAGFNIHKHWVTRQADGSGISETRATPMNAELFPVFLLSEHWPEAQQAKLASDYLEWIAPCLLTLQHLSGRDRARMERCLSIQAVSVEHHWHLYPEMIDENAVLAARVQNRLQQANQGGQEQP